MHTPTVGAERRYQDALNEGRFEIQQCNDCTRHFFYPRQLCPHCGSENFQWVTPSGRGTVYATTTVRIDADPALHRDITLINLEEGVRVMSRVSDLPPGTASIGQVVHANVELLNGVGVLLFTSVKGA
jgi:uncharacterized OB-fold protein